MHVVRRTEPRRLRAAALGLLAVSLAACAYPLIRPNAPIELDPDEGILVLHTLSPWPIRHIDANGRTVARDIPAGDHIYLVRVPAGDYRWSEIIFDRWAPYRGFDLFEDNHWAFSVEAGKVNYPGQVRVEKGRRLGFGAGLVARSINRSAVMIESLREVSPGLLIQFPVVYTGRTKDEFLSYYQTELRAKDASAAGNTGARE